MSATRILTESTPSTISVQELTRFCDDYLSADAFRDYAPNGLQVDGGRAIQRIVTGVTACEALIDAAIADKQRFTSSDTSDDKQTPLWCIMVIFGKANLRPSPA